MRTVRAPIADLGEGERVLGAEASHYLTRVLRLAAGAAFVAFDPESTLEADGVVVRTERDRALVRLGPTRAARVVATREITWIHALAKADKCDAIVRDATELGATRVIVAITERCVVKLDAARARTKQRRWETIAQEAARQSGRSDPPTVEGPLPWAEALALGPAKGARFVLDTTAGTPLLGAPLAAALLSGTALAFAAGPEGGLTDGELAVAREAGWRAASLGPSILRTETVCAAVLGAARVLGE